MDEDALPLKLEGVSVDSVYENFVRQIAGDALATTAHGETLKEAVDRDEKRQVLQTQIAKLQKKIKKRKAAEQADGTECPVEEADTLFKKIMSKINDTADSVDSIIKIVGWATTVYNMVLPLLP